MENRILDFSRSHEPSTFTKKCHHYHIHGPKCRQKFCKYNDIETDVESDNDDNKLVFQMKKSQSERSLTPVRDISESNLKLKKKQCTHRVIVRKTPSAVSIVGTKPPRIYIVDARRNKDAKPINIREIREDDTSEIRENSFNLSTILMFVVFITLVLLFALGNDLQKICSKTYKRGASYKRFGIMYYFCHLLKLFKDVNIFV